MNIFVLRLMGFVVGSLEMATACSRAGSPDTEYARDDEPIRVTKFQQHSSEVSGADQPFVIVGPGPITASANPVVSWNAYAGARDYDVIVSRKRECRKGVQAFGDVSGLAVALKALDEGIYFVCLAAIMPDGSVVRSTNSPFEFKVDLSAPAAPQLHSPLGIAENTTLDLSWDAVDGVEFYRVVIGRDDKCKGIEHERTGVVETSYRSPVLPDGEYFVCIKAVDAAGNESITASGTPFSIDNARPRIANISIAGAQNRYVVGDTVTLVLLFSEPVSVTLTEGSMDLPRVLLDVGESGGFADLVPGQESGKRLLFRHIVKSGESTELLDVSPKFAQLILGETLLRDLAGHDADLELPRGTERGSLPSNRTVVFAETLP